MSDQSGSFVRQTLKSVLLIVAAVFLCSISSVVGIDVLCHNDIEQTLPLYPGAELVSEESGFFRVRGMGVSQTILRTSDSVAAVRKWYGDRKHELERQSYDESSGRNTSPRHLSTVDVALKDVPETGQTLITLTSECAYN
jgi:hypothetical protein